MILQDIGEGLNNAACECQASGTVRTQTRRILFSAFNALSKPRYAPSILISDDICALNEPAGSGSWMCVTRFVESVYTNLSPCSLR